MAKYLNMNADDFGYSEPVNTGIMEAHSFGIVTSSSLMANMPAFQQAVGWALRTPSLGVGLHFNLTCGTAIAPLSAFHPLREGTAASRNSVTTEIMCHPRYREDDHPLRIAPEAKDGKLWALTSPILRDAIRVQSIRLIHFGHVAKVSYVD
ncbi:ChbG/HpnK family deacetylase [Paenibacillus dendritiformis]|uniref:ChbG/HpnK family deacetylase n=1 Tax=Paenibacillus dendritiformis TaxID=130049 RepID=UPI0015EBF801|nr:ChbG/HpnK family deacetylase [Paenibacillus dendritiformis]